MDLNIAPKMNVASIESARDIVRRAQYWLWRNDLNLASEVVVVGVCMKSLLMTQCGAEVAEKVLIIPIWQAESDEIASVDSRSEYGLPQAELLILYQGHAGVRHPLSAVAAAVKLLRQRGDRVAFIVSGTGSERDRLERSVGLSSDDHGIYFVDRPAGMAPMQWTTVADLNVVSLDKAATGTCVPSKTYSAMAAGRPVLYVGAADGQAAIDVASSGAGVVVASDEPVLIEELIAAMLRYMSPALRSATGQQGREFFRTSRTLSVIGPMWVKLLSQTPRPLPKPHLRIDS